MKVAVNCGQCCLQTDKPIKDSGQRVKFDTGSVRDSEQGKGRYDLLPFEALQRYAGVMEKGATKYNERNWEKGQDFARVYRSALRHLLQWHAGWRDEDHLAQAFWNIGALITFEARILSGQLPRSLDNLPVPFDAKHGTEPEVKSNSDGT